MSVRGGLVVVFIIVLFSFVCCDLLLTLGKRGLKGFSHHLVALVMG